MKEACVRHWIYANWPGVGSVLVGCQVLSALETDNSRLPVTAKNDLIAPGQSKVESFIVSIVPIF